MRARDNSHIKQEYVKSIFDYKDGLLYWKVKLNQNILIGSVAGTIGSNNRRYVVFNKQKHLVSRVIFFYHHNLWPDVIDHIDRNTLNDRIENLRGCSQGQNQANKLSLINSRSKYKGVYPYCNKWSARIGYKESRITIGYYKTENEAALAYNKKAIELYGEFALLNILQP